MLSVSKLTLDSDTNLPTSIIGWDDMPTEIVLYIFKKLDIKSLRCCLTVSRKWKEMAVSLCELQGLWQELAKDGIVNHGVTHRFKSTLSWKELYLNSLLWNNLQSASIGKLIVITKNYIEYFDIESFQRIRNLSIPFCEDLQETDDICMLVTTQNDRYVVTVFLKLDKDEEVDVSKHLNPLSLLRDDNMIYKTYFSKCLRWRIVGNCGYIIDTRYVLWEFSSINKKLSMKSLARCYDESIWRGHSCSLTSIHVIKEDVYIAVKLSDLMMVSENNMMFYKVNSKEIPTIVIEGPNLNKRPPYREGADKFDAIIKVPFAVGFRDGMIPPSNMLHFHYDDPEMTCGLQHGDVVFRGFENGKVDITLLRDNTKLEFNVKRFDSGIIGDPAVIGLEVCEVKNMHKLFIATGTKLYTLIVMYLGDLLEK